MPPLARHLSLALILLLVFLAAAFAAQAWLQSGARRVQNETLASRRAEFLQALELIHRPPESWDDAFEHAFGAMLGGTVTRYRGAVPPPAAKPQPGLLSFDYAFPGDSDLHALVAFPAPAAARLVVAQGRMLVAVTLLGGLLLIVSIVIALPHRPSESEDSRPPRPGVRAEMSGLEHFARISVERGEALARESGARHRAEEDLQLSRTLLGQSLEERIQLGRELHDNICQTLYAVSLSLEALRRKVAGNADAEERLGQSIAELRRLNHEVRAYIRDLEPDTVHRQPFIEALTAMLASVTVAGGPRLAQSVDPEVIALLAPERATEVIHVLREGVSNSVRHGHPKTVTVRAIRGDGSMVFAVQDDGVGFAPALPAMGHGLGNMRARAEALGGTLEILSAPDKGTRVLLTLPVAAAAAAT